jgi:hypothetical protein
VDVLREVRPLAAALKEPDKIFSGFFVSGVAYLKIIHIFTTSNNTDMTTQNTTSAKQTKLVAFAKQLGITIESLERMYQDPVKASFLNVIAQGL